MGKPSPESGKSLAAVVVTFNRADKLRNVLNALLEQTRKPDRVYVIDNASTDETPDVIGSFDPQIFQHVRLAENVGGAGGFNAGLRRAYEDGHDYFWISDDDAYPAPDAIEILEREVENFDSRTEYRAPFACSRVDWTDGTICNMNNPETVWDWARWYEKDSVIFLVNSCSFVSVLVSRWAVEKHGLPIKDYFIWQDDVEYTLRLSRSYPGLFLPGFPCGSRYGKERGYHVGETQRQERVEIPIRRAQPGLAGAPRPRPPRVSVLRRLCLRNHACKPHPLGATCKSLQSLDLGLFFSTRD